jgi:N-acetylneuraminate synthase
MFKLSAKTDKEEGKAIIVAEVSANHGQDLNRAIKMIRAAKDCGADAVKFQAYTPDSLTIDVDNRYFRIKHPKWGGQTLYQLYKKAYTPWTWFKKLKKAADDLGIIFFSTAFDRASVDFLEEIGVRLHKIASFEIIDLPLIEYTASTKKPLILSTGMATISEIKEAIAIAKKAGARDIILLKCVSSYPAHPIDMNLKTIPDMRKRFGLPIGISDHSLGIGVSIAAVCLGATMVEKHFTLSRRLKTPDSFFSLEPNELKDLVFNIKAVEESLGEPFYGPASAETRSMVYRRSLFAVKDIGRKEIFTKDNIRSIRPAYGLKPKYLGVILGKRAVSDIKKGTPIKFKHIFNYKKGVHR